MGSKEKFLNAVLLFYSRLSLLGIVLILQIVFFFSWYALCLVLLVGDSGVEPLAPAV
jgi:hypothetical protein